MSEQDILNFCEVTGAKSSDAMTYLEIANNDVTAAIDIYLDSIGAHQAAPIASSFSSRPESTQSDDDNIMTDEEIARQMQEQEEVRAPIASKTDILAGGSTSDLYSSPMWSRRDHIGISRPSVFNQGDSATGSTTDFLSRLQSEVPNRSSSGSPSEALGSPATAKAKRLADLFKPPFDIMYHGSFEKARETAKEKNKWLMINVQDPTEFSCQVLNRDLWSDAFVKDIVKESFIFLQYIIRSPDGERYNTLYPVNGYPHIAIIDARTGERIKVWEKALSPTDFMMDVTEFTDQNSPDSPNLATLPKRPKKAKNVSDMSEEEQLNAAIAASLDRPRDDTASGSTDVAQMDIETKQTSESTKGKENSSCNIQDEDEQQDDEDESKAGSAFDGIEAEKRDETTDMANSTKIQLRMSDGSRIIRRFLKTDPVRYIFQFVKSDVPLANDQQFELVFNRTQLINVLDQTIEEAGLSNAAVNCVIV